MNRPFIAPRRIGRAMGESPTPAESLRASAATFAAIGRRFDADFSLSMARAAEIDPALYAKWADDQAERASRLENAK